MLVVTRDVWSCAQHALHVPVPEAHRSHARALGEQLLRHAQGARGRHRHGPGLRSDGPLFIDKNVLGKHIELRARFDTIVNREDFLNAFPGLGVIREDTGEGGWTYEGTQSSISVTKPLWSLASKWGGGATFSHRYATDRRYFSTTIRPVRCPLDGSDCATRISSMPDEAGEFDPSTSPPEELLPVEYAMRRFATSLFATRQWDGKIATRSSSSRRRSSTRSRGSAPTSSIGSRGRPSTRTVPRRAALPRSDTLSEIGTSYGFFTPALSLAAQRLVRTTSPRTCDTGRRSRSASGSASRRSVAARTISAPASRAAGRCRGVATAS